MSKRSVFQKRALGPLAFGCAAAVLGLLASIGTAHAQVATPIVHGTLDLSHPKAYNVNQGEFDTTPPFETVDELSVFYSFFLNGTLSTLPATFAPGQEGDVVFIEENPALTIPQQIANCQAFINADPIGLHTFVDPGPSGCVLSDVVRFVNVTDPVTGLTQGHVYFLSDGLDPLDFALVPAVAGPRNIIATKVEQAPPLNLLNKVQLVRTIAGTNQRLIITYASDTGEVANVSDTATVTAVPALSPVAVLAMGVLLIGLGIAFVARRRQGGGLFSA